MPRWHNHYLDGHAHFCTATVSGWQPLLTGAALDLLYDQWRAAREATGVKLLAYVVMPDHFHAVVWAERGRAVSRFLQRTVGLTSSALQPGGGFWKERPRVLPVYSRTVLEAKLDYLHSDPVRTGLVSGPAEWEHSSYRQLHQGLTQIAFVCDTLDGIPLR